MPMSDLAKPKKALNFKTILAAWLVIVGAIAIGAFIDSRYPTLEPQESCFQITARKRALDSLFRPVQCKGIIRKVRVEPRRNRFRGYTWLTIEPIAGQEFVGQPVSVQLLDFAANYEVSLGLEGVDDPRLEVGDTFYKAKDEIFFFLFPVEAQESIRCELDPPNPQEGLDWTYVRDGVWLCRGQIGY
jgi:hypothetical protein